MQSSLEISAEFDLEVIIALLSVLVLSNLTLNDNYSETRSRMGWIETIHYD